MPLRTPRDAVGKLTPLRNLSAANVSHSKLLVHGNQDHDSDACSDDSFESELSLTERRLHSSALVSSYRFDLLGESTSSDDERVICEPEIQMESSLRSLHSSNKKSNKDAWKKAKQENHSLRRLRECPRAYWPNWVYRMQDSYCLAQRLSGTLPLISILLFIVGYICRPYERILQICGTK